MLRTPFDLATIERCPDWRERMIWPLSQEETLAHCRPVIGRILEAIRGIEDAETARIAEILAPRAFNIILPAIHAAAVLQAAAYKGIELIAQQPEFGFLNGTEPTLPNSAVDRQLAVGPAPRLERLRRFVRPRHWTPWYRMPATVLWPGAIAVNHSDMLADRARFTGARVGYIDSRKLYRDALAKVDETAVDRQRSVAAADALIATLPIPKNLDAGLEKRLRKYLTSNLHTLCEGIALGLTALRAVRRLPMHIWNGSAGSLPGAMISSEVLRRDGEVTAFDHCTGRGLDQDIEFTAMLELALSSRFVVATPPLAEKVNLMAPQKLLHPRRHCEVIGGRGYGRIRDLNLTERRRRTAGQKLRVTYASPIFRGWRQATPATTSDPVQLDWELRLVALLKSMPIDLICRPHPEGILKGRPHPLEEVASVSPLLFEELIEHSDLFVFDWYRSSTFWIALCTDRPIVMIELGYSYRDVFFTPEIRDAIERRCRFVRANTDDRNRLTVDEAELTDAILSAPDRVDAAEFQSLLIGETR